MASLAMAAPKDWPSAPCRSYCWLVLAPGAPPRALPPPLPLAPGENRLFSSLVVFSNLSLRHAGGQVAVSRAADNRCLCTKCCSAVP